MFCDTENYEEECRKIREENAEYLGMLYEYLTAAGLAKKTISKHMSNADFFLNDYLLHDEPVHMTDGLACVNSFLGDFFIRKCLWSTPDSLRSTATSLKKLYKCMAEHGLIDMDSYDFMCSDIKSCMPFWVDELTDYSDFV